MEHIVQFAIGIDDEAIKRNIETNAEKTVIDNITKDITSLICDGGYYNSFQPYSRENLGKLKAMVERRVDVVIESHKDIILEMAADKLADKLARSKAGKALLENINCSAPS